MRKIIYDNLHKIMAMLCVIVICIAVVFGCTVGTTAAYAESFTSVGYSDVLTDLQTDEDFDTDDYPADSEDYTLSIIQVAESTDGELLIYVYQPSFAAMQLTATQISMSLYEWHTDKTSIGNANASYKVYNLTLVSQKGVFQKYRVDSFTVSSDSTRYYDIATIYRDFNAEIDEETDDDNEVNGIGFEVGKCWAAKTDTSGNVTYEMQETEVVEITDLHHGFIRYNNGYEFWTGTSNYVDGHYIAFSTDYDIDKLYEIDISFITQSCTKTVVTQTYGSGSTTYTYGGEDYTYYYDPLTLTYTDKVTVDVSGTGILFWATKSYTWDRIQTASDFMTAEEDNLTDDTVTAISGMQYVVRFYETEYSDSTVTTGISTTYSLYSTIVSNVRVLRLYFEADGKTYNLGAVSNVQTGDTTPDGEDSYDTGDLAEDIQSWWESVKDWFSDLGSTVTTVLKVILGVILGVLAIWLISWIVKLIKMLVNSIKRVFKKDKNKKE